MKRTSAGARGLTLVELLVALCVVAVLAALLFAGAGRMSKQADVAKCVNNLRQLGTAMNASAAELGYYFSPRGKELAWKNELLKYVPDKRSFFCPAFIKVDALRGIMDDSGPNSWWQYGSPGYHIWAYPINDSYMPDDSRNLTFGNVQRTGFTWWAVDKPNPAAAPVYPAPEKGSTVLASDIFYGPAGGPLPWTTYHPGEGKREHGKAGVNAVFVDGHVEWVVLNKHQVFE